MSRKGDRTAEAQAQLVAEIEYDTRMPFSVGGITFWEAIGP